MTTEISPVCTINVFKLMHREVRVRVSSFECVQVGVEESSKNVLALYTGDGFLHSPGLRQFYVLRVLGRISS
ncbi:hypothetical protein JTB14_015729 [Gonioctena quinquepunctata]|nr:hypothetical protein JTB14_015729 [Gonioctena quinquepunctata]